MGDPLSMQRHIPWSDALGIDLESSGNGLCSMRLAWSIDGCDAYADHLAAGAVTTLMDHACGFATLSLLTNHARLTPCELKIDYLRDAAPRSAVTSWAHCYKIDGDIAFARAEAWDHDPRTMVALAQAIFVIKKEET